MHPSSNSILKDVARRLQRAAKNEERYLDEIKADPHKARRTGRHQKSEREFVIALFREWHDSPGLPLPPGTPLTVKVVNSLFATDCTRVHPPRDDPGHL